MKQIIATLIKNLALFSLNWLYNFIDDDKDGKITKKEILKVFDKIKAKV